MPVIPVPVISRPVTPLPVASSPVRPVAGAVPAAGAVTVRFITRAETVPLRRARLNPALPAQEAAPTPAETLALNAVDLNGVGLNGAVQNGAFQCGAFLEGELVAVVTFSAESAPIHDDGLTPPPFTTQWHLRALATAVGHEGKGLARQIIAFGLNAIFAAAPPGSTGVWLYGQEATYGFYRRLGFSAAGVPFSTDNGPYDLFWISGPLT